MKVAFPVEQHDHKVDKRFDYVFVERRGAFVKELRGIDTGDDDSATRAVLGARGRFLDYRRMHASKRYRFHGCPQTIEATGPCAPIVLIARHRSTRPGVPASSR